MPRYALWLVLLAVTTAHPARGFDLADYTRHVTPAVGTPLAATPGQRFYEDTWLKYAPQYEIPAPFESRMPGSMGIRFSFAIDATVLAYVGKSRDGTLDYYVPEDGRFRAWHGLVGNVLSPGDTVGLRVDRSGRMEWFVDNSVHNNMFTIWSRKVKEDDPALTKSRSKDAHPFGAPIRRLDYLGVRGDSVAVRLTVLEPDLPPRVDEFFFQIDANGYADGAVMGAEFRIRVGQQQRAEIVVTSTMTDEYAEKLPSIDKSRTIIRPGERQASLGHPSAPGAAPRLSLVDSIAPICSS